MKHSVSAIIPFYNNEKFIEKNLNSILKQTYPIKEIILVNDASTDNSEKIAKKLAKKHKKVFLISLKKNRGPAVARNVGFEKSKGDIIFFVESDAIFDKNYLKYIVERMDKTEKVAGGIGIRIPMNYKKNNILHRWSKDTFELLPKIRDPLNVWVYFREAFKEAGGFKENNLRLGEDADLGERIKSLGYKMFFEEKSKFYHSEPSSLKELLKKSVRNGKNAFPFYIKNWKRPFHYKAQVFHLLWFLSAFSIPYNLIPFLIFSTIWLYFYIKSVASYFTVDKNWRIFLFPIINSLRSIFTLIGIFTYSLRKPLAIFS